MLQLTESKAKGLLAITEQRRRLQQEEHRRRETVTDDEYEMQDERVLLRVL